MRLSSSCVLKIPGNNGITNGWCQEVDLPTKYLQLKSLYHGTLAKQGAPSKRSWSKGERSVSITLRYWSIMTGLKEVQTIVYNEFNMQLLIVAHAQHREQQPPDPHEEDNEEDDDDNDDVEGVLAV
jgi:hypothetical protein